jgi:AraC-like DNA-binding protein/quercetin dioxygenase-like cupin family protein
VDHLTHGSRISTRLTTRFTLNEVLYGPDDRYAAHAHDFAYVLLVLRGGFREVVGRRSHEGTSGSVILMPAGTSHENAIAPRGAKGLLVTFPPDVRLHGFGWYDRGGMSRSMLRLYEIYRDQETLAIEELLLQVATASECCAHAFSDRRTVMTALTVLQDRACDALQLNDVASAAGVTASYLARAFKRETGTTMGDHLRGLRASRAAQLLASTDLPLAEIATSCAFADQSHFSRVFKQQFGFTPGAYRSLVR